ncbi:MAG: hypothetical protein ACI87E_004315, partial [Mariniblastus sp.]
GNSLRLAISRQPTVTSAKRVQARASTNIDEASTRAFH